MAKIGGGGAYFFEKGLFLETTCSSSEKIWPVFFIFEKKCHLPIFFGRFRSQTPAVLFSRYRFFDFFRETFFSWARMKMANFWVADEWGGTLLSRSRTSDGLEKKAKGVKKVFAQWIRFFFRLRKNGKTKPKKKRIHCANTFFAKTFYF